MEKKDWRKRLGYYEDGIYIDGEWEDSEEKLFKFIEQELDKARKEGFNEGARRQAELKQPLEEVVKRVEKKLEKARLSGNPYSTVKLTEEEFKAFVKQQDWECPKGHEGTEGSK
jgi:hypothetical protein